mmetsp:Transcript_31044/g.57363  ORF Transcript_31044/g.57363 Transcript_31044/m.57363 type:complete len:346 (-) Transcript_31044:76-1113(-)
MKATGTGADTNKSSAEIVGGGTGGETCNHTEPKKPPTAVAAAAIFFPCLIVCSVGMILLNKTLSVSFPHPNTILGLQNGASVVYLLVGSRFLDAFDLSVPFRLSQFRPFVFPTFNWVVMLALSLKMLQYNSVATMVMFKTLGTILTCAVEIFYFGVRYSRNAKVALGVLALGSAIYAGTDVGYSSTGYFWATLQILSWVLQTFVEKIATVDSEQTKAGVAVIRNILSLPVVAFLIVVSGEAGAVRELLVQQQIWGQVALSSFLGCGLGLSTSALYKTFAPTAVVVANNVGKCISIVLGCIIFNDILIPTQIIGLMLSLAGSFWYGQEEKKRLEEKKDEADHDSAV